jgi:hypothetical protein
VCEGANLWFPWDGFALEAAVLLSLFPAVVRCRDATHFLRTGRLRQLPRAESAVCVTFCNAQQAALDGQKGTAHN